LPDQFRYLSKKLRYNHDYEAFGVNVDYLVITDKPHNRYCGYNNLEVIIVTIFSFIGLLLFMHDLCNPPEIQTDPFSWQQPRAKDFDAIFSIV
jgi:hypothetical protein